ncbi:MAG: tyrosine--tRNA ligase [Natronomonas sp.]
MDSAERTDLLCRFTEEVIETAELTEQFESGTPTAYIGYAPTGEMHIGHYTTIRKLVDFLDAGVEVTVLIADLHAHLDDAKSPFELLDARSRYYRTAIEAMIDAAGGDPEAISFVRGTEFQLEEPYTLDLYRLLAETTVSRARRAGSEVVRESDSPALGGLVYTLMQALDVAALDADIAYGGIDQRGIYMLARETLPEFGYEKPTCVFAPLLSGLSGGKMSASEAASKVNLTDDDETIATKIQEAYCPAGELEDNGVVEYLRYLVFPVFEERGETLVVERPEEYGGDLTYDDYETLEADYVSGELHPADLKPAAAAAIAEVIAPIRSRLQAEPELLAEAYPDSE